MFEDIGRPHIYLRFGLHKKKDLMRDAGGTYDGIVLPANILLYQAKATPSVVFSVNKPFFVDPMTYLFGHPFEQFKRRSKKGNEEFKPSFRRLIEGYGLTPDTLLDIDSLSFAGDLDKSTQRLESFVEFCLDFQVKPVFQTAVEAEKYSDEPIADELKQPQIYIPPYLPAFSGEMNSNLLQRLNIKFLEQAARNLDSRLLYPVAYMSRHDLKNGSAFDYVRTLSSLQPGGICIWIDDFDERNISENEAIAFISIISFLKQNAFKVVLLNVGYFGILTHLFGADVVSHGVAYGESKSMAMSVSRKSGPVPVRYYVPDLHTFFTVDNAFLLLRQFPELICDCPVCRRIVRKDPRNILNFKKEEALAELHFLYNRRFEAETVGRIGAGDAIDQMSMQYTLYGDFARHKLGTTPKSAALDHLSVWSNALNKSAANRSTG